MRGTGWCGVDTGMGKLGAGRWMMRIWRITITAAIGAIGLRKICLGRLTVALFFPSPSPLMTVELKVRMCCTGCERVVKNAIYKLKGIDSVEVDLKMEKVTVGGYVDRNKVLKAVRRAGKRAEFWPYPNPPLYFTTADHYFKDTTHEFKESYNYYRHGYNLPQKHGTIHVSHRGDDNVSNMFNDDNVNACSVM
ncbi:heavy metal-associated isoprenylated plant protein 30-like isoform X2 [Vigna unguiculata]|nr:heavy metal-associated isoprenylated plant protein 30-like isoform X2 [Vigna unguiculata]